MTIVERAIAAFRPKFEAELVEACLARPELVEVLEEATKSRGMMRQFEALSLPESVLLGDCWPEDKALQEWLTRKK